MIKNEKFFDKYMKIQEKVRNIIKIKFNSDLIKNKIYLKVKKNQNKRKRSMFLCAINID